MCDHRTPPNPEQSSGMQGESLPGDVGCSKIMSSLPSTAVSTRSMSSPHVAGLATDGEKVRRLLAILADAQLAQYRRRYRDLDEVLLQRGPGGKQTGHRHPAMSEEVCGRAATPPRLTRAGGSFEAAGAGWVVRPFPPQQTGLGSLRAAVVRPAYPEFRPATINGYLRLLRV